MTVPEPLKDPLPDKPVVVGRLAEWWGLLETLSEHQALTVLVADPNSGTSPLLAAALVENAEPHLLVDARRCADALDLAMAVADAAIATFEPDATAWWLGTASPSSTAGLRLSRSLSDRGVDLDGLRDGAGPGSRRLREALDLVAALAPNRALLAVDHLGTMLASLRATAARELLGELRSALQRSGKFDLVVVDHPRGPMSLALADAGHPLYLAGERLRLRRPHPDRFVDDLAAIGSTADVPADLLVAAAEIAAGVPQLTWQVVALAPPDGGDPARALGGWQALRHITSVSVRQQWDLLRSVHPSAQALVCAVSLGLRPHSLALASKTVDDALNRLRDVGLAWQPVERSWAIADPLLAAYGREHAPPWALRRSAHAS